MSPVYFEKDGRSFLNGVVDRGGRLSLCERLPCLRVVSSSSGDIGLTRFGVSAIDAVLKQGRISNLQVKFSLSIPQGIGADFGRPPMW